MKKHFHMYLYAFVVICASGFMASVYAQLAKTVATPKVPMVPCSGFVKTIDPAAKTLTVDGSFCKNRSFTSEVDISGFKVGDRVSVHYLIENKKYIATSVSNVEGGSQPPIFSCNGNIRAINPTAKTLTVKGINCDSSFTSEISIDSFKVNDHVVVKHVQQNNQKIAKSVEVWHLNPPQAPKTTAAAKPSQPAAAAKVQTLPCAGIIKGIDPAAKTLTVNGALCKNRSFTSEVDISGFKVGDRVSVHYRIENKKHIATSVK